MDRFLRNLLTSSAGVDLVTSDSTLSEIARSLLADGSGEDQRSLREKAGLLALLNLLGIVESFYGEGSYFGEGQFAEETAITTMKPAETQNLQSIQAEPPDIGSAREPITPLFSILSKLLAGQGSMDPAMLTSLIGLVSSLSKVFPGKASVPDEQESEEGSKHEDPDQAEGVAPEAGITRKLEHVSPLQQILGMDPKLLTAILNFIANMDFMRSKTSQEPKVPPVPESAPEVQDIAPEATPVRLSEDKRQLVVAKSRPKPSAPRTGHKPGFGIYRGWPGKPALQ